MSREYKFHFEYDVLLKSGRNSGRTFIRSGEIMGKSIRDATNKIQKENPGCVPIVTTMISGITGSEAAFYSGPAKRKNRTNN